MSQGEELEKKESEKGEASMREIEETIKSLWTMRDGIYDDYAMLTSTLNNVDTMFNLLQKKEKGELELKDLFEIDINFRLTSKEFRAEAEGCILSRVNLSFADKYTINEFLSFIVNKENLLCMMHELLVLVNMFRGYGDNFGEQKGLLEKLLGIESPSDNEGDP